MELGPYLTPLTKINLKWIESFNVRPKAITIVEENIGKNFLNIGLGNDLSL